MDNTYGLLIAGPSAVVFAEFKGQSVFETSINFEIAPMRCSALPSSIPDQPQPPPTPSTHCDRVSAASDGPSPYCNVYASGPCAIGRWNTPRSNGRGECTFQMVSTVASQSDCMRVSMWAPFAPMKRALYYSRTTTLAAVFDPSAAASLSEQRIDVRGNAFDLDLIYLGNDVPTLPFNVTTSRISCANVDSNIPQQPSYTLPPTTYDSSAAPWSSDWTSGWTSDSYTDTWPDTSGWSAAKAAARGASKHHGKHHNGKQHSGKHHRDNKHHNAKQQQQQQPRVRVVHRPTFVWHSWNRMWLVCLIGGGLLVFVALLLAVRKQRRRRQLSLVTPPSGSPPLLRV
eukprot:TRINITY_DN5883_c0_g1_i1.p1 TRINITY_DN5883_c0_g1~~TRINITY_DN5883_c0_g1_i1.p1  ORF type:complete len:342 (-),score=125.09 TRINITY_DN5883_c0_g1_i1:33-1058(-)